MANAAAKKAAAARQSAVSLYKPILLSLNIIYLLLRFFVFYPIHERWTIIRSIVFLFLFWGLTYYAYVGIVQDYENMASFRSQLSMDPQEKKRLPGGVYLDVLAFVLLIQFGSLWKSYFLWLLWVFPFWGGWSLYQMLFRSEWSPFGGTKQMDMNTSMSSSTNHVPIKGKKEDEMMLEEKRRKRAEKRRQKWS